MPLTADVPVRAVGASGDEHECQAVVVGREGRITATVDAGDPTTDNAGDFFEALRMVRRVTLRDEVRLTIESAFRAGREQRRCAPNRLR
jgi:hypothetical protein